MRAIGSDEVDHRQRVLDVLRKIDPAFVRHEESRIAGFEQLRPRLVQSRHARVAAASDVDRRKVERQAEQVVAQRVGHEFVDMVAVLRGQAAEDRTGRLVGADGTVEIVVHRVEERLDQSGRGDPFAKVANRDPVAFGIIGDGFAGIVEEEAVHVFRQH